MSDTATYEENLPTTAQPVSAEQAHDEIHAWLDYKQVSQSVRDSNEKDIDLLIEEMTQGRITIDDKHQLHYQLKFPLKSDEGATAIDHITFRPRLKMIHFENALSRAKVKSDNGIGTTRVLIATLTGQPSGIIGNLDSSDNKVCMAVAGFFI